MNENKVFMLSEDEARSRVKAAKKIFIEDDARPPDAETMHSAWKRLFGLSLDSCTKVGYFDGGDWMASFYLVDQVYGINSVKLDIPNTGPAFVSEPCIIANVACDGSEILTEVDIERCKLVYLHRKPNKQPVDLMIIHAIALLADCSHMSQENLLRKMQKAAVDEPRDWKDWPNGGQPMYGKSLCDCSYEQLQNKWLKSDDEYMLLNLIKYLSSSKFGSKESTLIELQRLISKSYVYVITPAFSGWLSHGSFVSLTNSIIYAKEFGTKYMAIAGASEFKDKCKMNIISMEIQ